MKYELTDETITVRGVTLYRIKATKSFGVVSKGDIGGYIEKESNLTQYGDAWVYGDARVYGNARVSGTARVYDDAWVYGNARVSGNAWVSGTARVYGNARVYGDARVSDNAWVYGNARVSGTARVYGDAWEFSPLFIQGTKHSIYEPKRGRIKIGCEDYTIQEWLDNFEKLGKENGYTKEQIDEYKHYIDLFAKLRL